VADAGADEDRERVDGGEVATPMPPPGARRQDSSSIMRAEFNPEVTTPFGDDERQQHTTPPRAIVKGVQLQVFRAMETKTFDFEMQDKLAAARAKLDLLRRKQEFLAARGIRHPLNRHGASDAEAFRKLFFEFVEFEAQVRRSNEPAAELKGEREKYGLQPGETMEQRYDELALRFKSLKAEHEGEDGKGGLVSKYDALEKKLNELKEMYDGGNGRGRLVSELEQLKQNHTDSTGRYNDLSEKYHGKDGNGGVVSELGQLKQHHGNSANRSEHLEESDRGKGGQEGPEAAHGKLRNEAEVTAAQPETTQADNQELTKEFVSLWAAAESWNRVAEALEKTGVNTDHLYRYLNHAAAVSKMCADIKTWTESTHDADALRLFRASQDIDEAECSLDDSEILHKARRDGGASEN